jgi:NUMOD4 motif
MEEWLPVVGFEGYYEVSDLGHVRSLDRVVMRNGREMKLKGRELSRALTSDCKHLYVMLSVGNVQTVRSAHVLVAETFLGPRPEGMEICHGPLGGLFNWVTNLRYDTHANNLLDMVRDGGTQHHAHRTHCKKAGHPLSGDNLYINPTSGGRQCRACLRETNRKNWRRRNPGAPTRT